MNEISKVTLFQFHKVRLKAKRPPQKEPPARLVSIP